MKANHNYSICRRISYNAVVNISKIQNESKSQPIATWRIRLLAVVNISKIQNESKSQQTGHI